MSLAERIVGRIRLTVVALAGLCAAAGSLEAGEWKAGVASLVITPQQPTWLSGYASRTKPAEGKVHDLFAKALAIQSGDGTRLVLVTLDLGSVSGEITESVAKRVATQYGVPRESLVLNVSHTHCAPEVAAERRIFHALPDEEDAKLARYIAWLEDRLVELVGAAVADLEPARLAVSKSSAGFGYNRRLPTADDFINSQNVDGVTDREVPVLSVTDPAGKLRAILFGYACHNTTLAFQRYCGDYAGFAQQYLEEAYPEAKALFMMGCGGDQNPYPRHGERGLEYCVQHGRALADAVETALRSPQRALRGPLRVAFDSVTLQLEPMPPLQQLEADARSGSGLAQRKARYLLERLAQDGKIELTQTCPLHVARFGDDLLLIAISGETVVDYSLRSKREFAGPFVWVAGYCDDVFAYLPSQRVLREGGYEGRTGIVHQLVPTPFDESVEDRVMHGIGRLVEQTADAP
jgi:hypothetical protein